MNHGNPILVIQTYQISNETNPSLRDEHIKISKCRYILIILSFKDDLNTDYNSIKYYLYIGCDAVSTSN